MSYGKIAEKRPVRRSEAVCQSRADGPAARASRSRPGRGPARSCRSSSAKRFWFITASCTSRCSSPKTWWVTNWVNSLRPARFAATAANRKRPRPSDAGRTDPRRTDPRRTDPAAAAVHGGTGGRNRAMAYAATYRFAQISARKVRPLANLIRGKFADDALEILKYHAASRGAAVGKGVEKRAGKRGGSAGHEYRPIGGGRCPRSMADRSSSGFNRGPAGWRS